LKIEEPNNDPKCGFQVECNLAIKDNGLYDYKEMEVDNAEHPLSTRSCYKFYTKNSRQAEKDCGQKTDCRGYWGDKDKGFSLLLPGERKWKSGDTADDGSVMNSVKKRVVNCKFSDWGDWSECTRTCGGGTGKRWALRKIKVKAESGGEQCKGELTRSEDCNTQGCRAYAIASAHDDWRCPAGTQPIMTEAECKSFHGQMPHSPIPHSPSVKWTVTAKDDKPTIGGCTAWRDEPGWFDGVHFDAEGECLCDGNVFGGNPMDFCTDLPFYKKSPTCRGNMDQGFYGRVCITAAYAIASVHDNWRCPTGTRPIMTEAECKSFRDQIPHSPISHSPPVSWSVTDGHGMGGCTAWRPEGWRRGPTPSDGLVVEAVHFDAKGVCLCDGNKIGGNPMDFCKNLELYKQPPKCHGGMDESFYGTVCTTAAAR